VCTTLLNNHINAYLPTFLSPQQLGTVLASSQNIGLLPQELQTRVRLEYAGGGYRQQTRVMVFVVAGEILSLVLMMERKTRRMT
jgi:hypothetical protein